MPTGYFDRGGTDATNDWDITVASGDDLYVNDEFGPVVDNLGLSAIALESLQFIDGAIGRFGGGNAGPLEIEVDFSTDAKLIMHGTRVELNVDFGASGKCENVDMRPGNKLVVANGLVEDSTMQGGDMTLAGGAENTNHYQHHGESYMRYNSTAGTELIVVGGVCRVDREYENIYVGQGGFLILDYNDAVTPNASAFIEINGGTVMVVNAPIPIVKGWGGHIMLNKARRPFAFGATTFKLLGTKITEFPGTVDVSNISHYGAMQRPIGSPSPAP